MASKIIHPEQRLYPLTEAQIRASFPPNTTFENPFNPPEGFFWVHDTMPASFNSISHIAVETYPELVEGVWLQKWSIVAKDPQALEESMAVEKQKLKDKITALRWEVETGGMTLPNGQFVNTTSADQNRISNAITGMASLEDSELIDFKSASGWITITLGSLRGLGLAIMRFGQACFTAEKTHHLAVNALTTADEIVNYNYQANWPGRTTTSPP